jgi:phosphatidylglycerophosphate synthase
MPNQSYDGPVSRYLNRPLSQRLARLLARTSATPNLVSVLALAIAGCAFGLLAAGWNIVAAIAVHLSSVVDGADGDLARMKGASTTFGGILDSALDRWSDVLILSGMTLTASVHEDWRLAPVAGLSAIAGSLLLSYSRARIEASTSASGGHLLFGIASRDVRLFLCAIGVLVGQAYPTLWVLAGLCLLTVAWRLAVLPRALS